MEDAKFTEDPLRFLKSLETQPLQKDDDSVVSTPAPSTCTLIMMTVFVFPISLIWGTMGMVVLPAEALRLYPDGEALYLGIMMTVVAFSQLVCPVAGQLSDTCRSKWGKRSPYILVGTLITMVCCVGLWFSSSSRIPLLYLIALFVSQVGLNIVYTAQASLVPDTNKENMGNASGIIGVWQISGTFVGMCWLVATHETDYHYSYGLYLILLTVATAVLCLITERPTDTDPEIVFSWAKLMSSFSIDMDEDWDFFLVFIGRMFFYISTSCQTFSFYYFRDMLEMEDEGTIRKRLAIVGILGTGIGLCASYPLGKLSDNPNVGRKTLIYFSCISMAIVYVGYCLVPLFFEGQDAMNAVYVLGSLYGFAVSGYTSVDYALAIDCLPETQKGSSEALGLWGIAGFIGASAGPLVGGLLIQLHKADSGGYSYQGYVLMMSMGIISFLSCALVTSFIKKTQ